MKSSSIRSLTYISIGAALIAVLSQLSIPLGPVPFTLQTLAIGFIATLYKPREATASVILYLVLGAIGLPVFAEGAAGFQALFGATGGFLMAFVVYGLITSLLVNAHSSYLKIFLANCLGLAIVLLGGAVYFHFFSQASWADTLAWTVTPFILTGILKIIVILFLVKALRPVIKKEAYFQ